MVLSFGSRVLAESARFILVGDHEMAVLVDRATGQKTIVGDHYGDVQCGVIAPDESWIVTGGHGLQVYTAAEGRRDYRGDPPMEVHAMRLETPDTVRVLVDPWSPHAAVWIFTPLTGQLRKLHDGPDLREEPWREDVDY